MDTLSHALLGGAIGQLGLGRKVGNRAVAWGAAVALLPDIDVPLGALMGDAAALTFHRGITHSLLFVTLIAPLLGWLADRVHHQAGVGWKPWAFMLWLVLLSHLAIDAFTSYGIQLLLPFSERAYAIASISVIDPLYTLPLLLTVPALVWLHRDRRARRVLAWAGIGISSLYLAATLVNKWQVQQVFEQAFEAEGVEAQRVFVKPTFFNNVLWRGIAETETGYQVAFHSRLDEAPPDDFVYFPRNAHYLIPYMGESVIRDLLKVSDGYYQVVEDGGALYFRDLRYGQAFEWLRDERPHVFTYRIIPPSDGEPADIETLSLSVDRERDRETFRELIDRASGR
ncbi:MAG: metal-dependent hydrolase [Ectothiorhodospiraceae bacterium]|nr:metal-dependent hydrolase [Ectothiorhodospiraceae bacterium]MCH8503693.1 metal-dependent hydrolase [Ectothiorhodospiraceae bacterium]